VTIRAGVDSGSLNDEILCSWKRVIWLAWEDTSVSDNGPTEVSALGSYSLMKRSSRWVAEKKKTLSDIGLYSRPAVATCKAEDSQSAGKRFQPYKPELREQSVVKLWHFS